MYDTTAQHVVEGFYHRLLQNGAPEAKVRRAALKVGRLLAMQRLNYLYLGVRRERCQACPLSHEEPASMQHAGHGNPAATIALVGQGAGATEGQFGLPFVGIAGTLLTMALEDAGMPRETVWLSNIVHCHPRNNRAPGTNECQVCISTRLSQEIRIIRPKVVVALGNAAFSALTISDVKNITANRGRWFQTVLDGQPYPLLATYHPAYIVRQYGNDFHGLYQILVGDLKEAVKHAM